tara:strand:+ start:42 stop:158 length:117 start_codon:yes stop_codon:yes gene_type:complete
MIYYKINNKIHAFENREQAKILFSGIYKKYLRYESWED